MSIVNWPVDERPREKLIKYGAEMLSDAELLAIFLRTGIRNKSAVELARDLITKYGNLCKLLNSQIEDFCAQPGMGPSKYAILLAARELGRRYTASQMTKSDVLADPADCISYLMDRLGHRNNEVFAVLYLNNKNQLIAYEEHFEGSINASHVYPRTLIKYALTHNAAGVIFSHNHPSGDPEPSQADIRLTDKMAKILAEIDVSVLDHIIIGGHSSRSFKQLGLL